MGISTYCYWLVGCGVKRLWSVGGSGFGTRGFGGCWVRGGVRVEWGVVGHISGWVSLFIIG